MAVFRIKKEKDYTVMSNHHFRNRQLSLKAMGLLSLMLSLPETWDYTLAGLATICNDGISSVRSGVKELEEQGYLIRRRIRELNGQLGDTEYTILESPQNAPPTPPGEDLTISNTSKSGKNKNESSATEKDSSPKCSQPIFEKPICENPTLDSPTYENDTQLNTKESKTKESNTHTLNINQSIQSTHYPQPQQKKIDMDRIDTINTYREVIRDNIEYAHLCTRYKYKTDIINELVELMVETVCSTKKTIRISGEDIPAALVKSKFLKLDSGHIEYILECLENNASDIRNIKSYLLTTVYNAPNTIGNYYSAVVKRDMWG